MGPYEARGVKNGPFPAFVDTRGSENRDLAHLGCFGASEVQVGSGGKGNGERVRGPEAQGPRGPVEGVGPLGKTWAYQPPWTLTFLGFFIFWYVG